ncbi:zinc finger BED domain-containing protein 5-like [Oratosquilla oratoria]|uniref:zinc finger BED domain-containing protein 5-like n=1 Tax=Oratosquilla oratoria TaxID=337810 RepID=UPI003F776264
MKLAYLNDIFSRINAVNRSLQGYSATVIDFVDKLRAFQMKLNLWQEKVTAGRYDAFDNMSDSLSVLCKDDVNEVSGLIHKHLVSLSQELENYFPDITDLDCQLIRNPLKVDPTSLPDELQEEFIDFVNDSTAKDSFDSLPLTRFWTAMACSYPTLAKNCVRNLPMFTSTYRCEQGFSALRLIKNKLCSRLAVKDDIRVVLSKTMPRIDLLVANKQAQPSH